MKKIAVKNVPLFVRMQSYIWAMYCQLDLMLLTSAQLRFDIEYITVAVESESR